MAQCLKEGIKCPAFYECKEDGISATAGGWTTVEVDGEKIIVVRPATQNRESGRTMDRFCFYCLATRSGKKIANKASWTGRTPTWCPRGRD